jgi:hypothetical protein
MLKFQQSLCQLKINMFTLIYMPCALLRSDGRMEMAEMQGLGALKG